MLRLSEEFVDDPHNVYRQLRPGGPAHQVTMWNGLRAWMITGYDEARALLSDPRIAKDGATAAALYPTGTATTIGSVLGNNMLFKDPPDHTRLRRFVTAVFTSHAVQRLRPAIRQITDELLDAVEPGAPTDLMQSLAQPLPIRVIGELLGVPTAERERFRSLAVPIFTSTDATEIQPAQRELTALLTDVIAAKRSQPGDDVLSDLIRRRDDGDQLSEEELLGTAFLLIIAGFDTTVNLIGNGTLELLRHPDQLSALRADRTLLPGAIEEILRFESPLNTATVRFTAAPVTVRDIEIPAGELVLIALLSANRDERRFPDADRFDITRNGNRHIAFGRGIHHCVGAPLARMEAEIAFDRLLSRFGDIRLASDEPLSYRPSTLMRGLHALPVVLGPAA
ncbi:cytochrome P450 [Mycobacterium frederiksbergense]|uniref:cytochrome P450 family protein n=1 Tax=Mycolicibacterium frederiksbergense TaxID=117567 RepID=UPI0021F33B5F|nr:cytochrome P450 [Mycolicibacterium frederiksbergense]MCV7048107.1 cytochrome P450 [Mycolicibacterium frederiksbergense]